MSQMFNSVLLRHLTDRRAERYTAWRSQHSFEWPVNLALTNPSEGSSLAIVVGDDPDAVVLDLRTKAAVMHLVGHLDYSFAASWHPNEPHIVATGNQARPVPLPLLNAMQELLKMVRYHDEMSTDAGGHESKQIGQILLQHMQIGVIFMSGALAQDTSTRVWDLRKPEVSIAVMCGNMGAVRSLRYSPDGKYLAAAEPADFVRLYDVASDYTRQVFLPIAILWRVPHGSGGDVLP